MGGPTIPVLIGIAAIVAIYAAVGGPVAAAIVLVCGVTLGVVLIHFQK